jgi:hypothetical protein
VRLFIDRVIASLPALRLAGDHTFNVWNHHICLIEVTDSCLGHSAYGGYERSPYQ